VKEVRFEPGIPRLLPLALVTAALTLATYLYYGYAYGVWPGTALLDFVLRAKGELDNDWQTDQPAPHWAITHILAVLPDAWLEGAVLTIWILGLVVLWAGFAVMCRTLRMPSVAALGAGLMAIPTGFGGIGFSETLFGSMYPSQTAFAFSVAAVAAAVSRRCGLAGLLAGGAVLMHPSAGLIAVPVVAAALVGMVGRAWRSFLRFTLPLLTLAIPALIPIAATQGNPSTLSERERFELLAIVRLPHHVLYSHFGGYEYARTALWLCVVVAGATLLRRLPAATALSAGTVAALLGLVVGGIASAEEGPMLALQAQLSRLSPFVVLFGIVLGAAALTSLSRAWGTVTLFAVALVAHPIANATSWSLVSVSGVEAVIVLALLVFGAVVPASLKQRAQRAGVVTVVGVFSSIALLTFALGVPTYRDVVITADVREWLSLRAVVISCALALAGGLVWKTVPGVRACYAGDEAVRSGAIAMVLVANAIALVRAEAYVSKPNPVDRDWRQIAAATRAASKPDDVILTPPQNSGFRFFSHRPVVVEFGSFRYDSEDVDWARRIADVTGDPRTVDASFGTDVAARNALIAKAYDHQVERSEKAICKYDVAYIVADRPVKVPPWLARAAANSAYVLLRVKPATCANRLTTSTPH
jgi:Domain of unknown function (DUF6798)